MDLPVTNVVASSALELSATSMIMDPHHMRALTEFADAMSRSAISVPQHFRGKPADCLAVCMQALTWGMNPFSVAQKTHLTPGGALGYEAQLINAVVINRAPIKARPEFRFLGDWSRILGRVLEKTSEKGGKYYVATWDKKDEEGLGVVCSVTLIGEQEPREITVMMSQAYPRFSTQWATDPIQQITYLAVRKWARRYAPDVILGVYDLEEAVSIDGEARIIDVGQGSTIVEPTEAQRKSSGERLRERASKGTKKEETPDPLPAILRRIDQAATESDLEAVGADCKELKGKAADDAREAYVQKLRALRGGKTKADPAPEPARSEPATIDHETGEIDSAAMSME